MEELLSFWPWTVDPWQTSVIWQAHYFFQAFLIFQHQTNGLLVVFICGCWLFSVWQNILVVKIVRYKVTLLFWSFLWPVLIPGCHIATFFHAPSVPLANVLSLPRCTTGPLAPEAQYYRSYMLLSHDHKWCYIWGGSEPLSLWLSTNDPFPLGKSWTVEMTSEIQSTVISFKFFINVNFMRALQSVWVK